jgi:hypothetical protein
LKALAGADHNEPHRPAVAPGGGSLPRLPVAAMPDPTSPQLMQEIAHQHLFNQFWLSVFFVIPMVLVARAVVAGTRYSAILIIVAFGLLMGHLLVATGVSEPGLRDFPMLGMIAQSTVIALAASFFVGGQELRRILTRVEVPPDLSVVYSNEQIFLGTGRTQLVFIARAFFTLLGIEALTRLLLGTAPETSLARYYPLIAYMGLVIAVILIDHKATILDKRLYLRKGVAEIGAIVGVLVAGAWIAGWVRPLVALPQIFFVMLLSSGLGALLYRWRQGPALRCLLFAGIPVVLAGNFVLGGSRIGEAFALTGMNAVLAYGFFGQVLWMFGGIALLTLFAGTSSVRNLAPGMAGALSHAGLTGACTAGDLGEPAARRAPIMINIPFFGHVFVFSILALSVERGALLVGPALVVALTGIALTARSLVHLRRGRAGGARGAGAHAVLVRLAAVRRVRRAAAARRVGDADRARADGQERVGLALRPLRGDPGGHGGRGGAGADRVRLRHAVPRAPARVLHVRARDGAGRRDAAARGVRAGARGRPRRARLPGVRELSAGAARASHRREFATSSGFRNSRGASPGACTPAGADRPVPAGSARVISRSGWPAERRGCGTLRDVITL